MSSVAILVGIDAYKSRPLTSAVRDAERVRDALVRHALVEPGDITLLTSDATAPHLLPTRKNILAALRAVFEAKSPPDRMFFYFSGHGVLTFADAPRNITTTALATLDVEDFENEGDGYIDFRALRDTFRSAGPAEQYYFLDACRNLAWKLHPSINPTVGFRQQAPGPSRSQAVLYAVSQLGEAIADAAEGGYFTDFLLEALEADGLGIAYDASADSFVVTAQSIAEHVAHRARERLKTVSLWKHKYMVPEPEINGPALRALRVIDQVPLIPVTVHIEPDSAADETMVMIGTGRAVVAGISWPPNHMSHDLEPRIYSLMAESRAGIVDPSRRIIDVRMEREAWIHVAAAPPAPPPGPSAQPSPAEIQITAAPTLGQDVMVEAQALEPTVEILLTSRDSAGELRSGTGALRERVTPGAYGIAFRHGREVFSAGEFVARAGERVEVRSSMERLELLGTATGALPSAKVISESIGPMQAGVLETTLALIGFKPFDELGIVGGQLNGAADWRSFDPGKKDECHVSIVLALEGNGWEAAPDEIISQTECSLVNRWGGGPFERRVKLRPLRGGSSVTGLNGARIGLATLALPALAWFHQFGTLTIANDRIVRLRLSLGSKDNHITVVTILVRPDGSVDLAQYVLPQPGYCDPITRDDLYETRQLSRWVRALHTAQKLLERSESLSAMTDELPPMLGELFAGRRYDPLLSAEVLLRQPSLDTDAAQAIIRMGKASRRRGRSGFPGDEASLVAILASGFAPWLSTRLTEVVKRPALMSTARLLARKALEIGINDAPVLEALRWAVPGSLWLYQRDPPMPTEGKLEL